MQLEQDSGATIGCCSIKFVYPNRADLSIGSRKAFHHTNKLPERFGVERELEQNYGIYFETKRKMRGLILILDVVLFSEVKQVLLMLILHKFSQNGTAAPKTVQESQTILFLLPFPCVFGILLVNDGRSSTPTVIDKIIRSYCIYSMLLSNKLMGSY